MEVRSQGVLAFGRDIPSSGPDVRFNRLQIGPTPFLTLGPGSDLEVSFRSPRGGTGAIPTATGSSSREVDVALFARDPDEFVETFLAAPHTQVRSLLSTPRLFPTGEQVWMVGDLGLPSALLVPYFGTYPTSVKLGPIDAASFWLAGDLPTFPSAWTAPGSNPLGYGSVKAVHVATHDACEFHVSVQDDVFTSLRTDLPRSILGGCGTSSGVFPNDWESLMAEYFNGLPVALRAHVHDIQLEDFGMASFLRSAPADPLGSGGGLGGFILRGTLTLNVDLESIPFGLPVSSTPCIADFAYEYTFALDDGRLIAKVREASYADFGGAPAGQVCGAARSAIRNAFMVQIPDRIATTARNQQLFDFAPGLATKCTPADPAMGAGEDCSDAAEWSFRALQPGYARLAGYPSWGAVPAVEQQAVHDEWVRGASTLSQNWTCADRDFIPNPPGCQTHATTRQCVTILRAQDLVHEPGAVNLKWFGAQPGSITQAQLVYALALGSSPGDLGRLCNRAPTVTRGTSGTPLHFANAYSATSYIRSLSCSTLVGRGFAPDRCCETDQNCITNPPSQTCDVAAHRCKSTPNHACTSDVGCFDFERCDGATQRCVPIVQPPRPCPTCPVCDRRDPFAPTICPTGTFCQDSSVGPECRR